ncbi:MAG: helix-turn-helix transcriptional regulator [Clostridiales bacterium]|nr:helix-turn-helix transcriptional regulator [Clostridiales bacterium]MBP3941202.1 helix-turn-helix transcriptional regulator [Christensenellaceae bacterium]
MENLQDTTINCPYMTMQRLLSGKWTLLILCYLRRGALRFSELMRYMPTLTQATLTKQLRKLENDDLIKRTIYPEVPPRVEYELTETGKELLPVLDTLGQFGMKYLSTHLNIKPEEICSDAGTMDCRCHAIKTK